MNEKRNVICYESDLLINKSHFEVFNLHQSIFRPYVLAIYGARLQSHSVIKQAHQLSQRW